jgi:hypothetical protein
VASLQWPNNAQYRNHVSSEGLRMTTASRKFAFDDDLLFHVRAKCLLIEISLISCHAVLARRKYSELKVSCWKRRNNCLESMLTTCSLESSQSLLSFILP